MKYYLLGASNPETIRMIRAVRSVDEGFEFAGMLDNDVKKHGADFYGLAVLGGIEKIPFLKGDQVRFVNLITRTTEIRKTTTSGILKGGGVLGNLIHPGINLDMVKIGVGLYLQEAVILQAEVEVGDNTSIHMGSLIGHETKIGSSVFIAHAVSVAGCCEIGEGVFIGTNASILPRVKIGQWATIGSGAVVTKNVPDYAVVVGNPGRVIKYNQPPGVR